MHVVCIEVSLGQFRRVNNVDGWRLISNDDDDDNGLGGDSLLSS